MTNKIVFAAFAATFLFAGTDRMLDGLDLAAIDFPFVKAQDNAFYKEEKEAEAEG